MKTFKLCFLFLLLVSVLALLVACNQPVGPNDDTTAPDQITTEPPASLGNPIREVVKTSDGKIGILYEDNSTMTFENIPLTDDRNSVIVTEFSLDEEKRELKITLADSASLNTANIFLKTAPPSVTLRLREKDGSFEWTRDEETSWQLLCPATDRSALIKLADILELGKATAPTEKNVIFVISGNTLRVRAKDWSREGYDLCYDNVLHETAPNSNHNFGLGEIYEIPSALPDSSITKGTYFKPISDNITAINFNGTYIAARHGYYCISELKNTFALTEKDIGTVFTRKNDKQRFVLVRAEANVVWFCPFDDAAMKDGNFSKYTNSNTLLKANQVLSAEGRADIIIPTNSSQQQLRTSTARVIQRAFLNGVKEVNLLKNALYKADYIDIYEEYDVLFLPSVLSFLMENAGNNTNESCHDESIQESYIHFALTVRFHRNGSYNLYQHNTVDSKINDVSYHSVISMALPGSQQYIYVPGSDNLSTPVLQTNNTITAIGNGKKVRDFYHFTDLKGTKGVHIGTYPYYGNGVDEIRGVSFPDGSNLGLYYNTRKVYPAMFKKTVMNPGDTISFISFHIPVTPIDEDFFSITWYFVGEDIFLSLNTDKHVSEKAVMLPEYMNGMKVSVETASEAFNIASNYITDNTITVSTTGAGWATVKLSPAE